MSLSAHKEAIVRPGGPSSAYIKPQQNERHSGSYGLGLSLKLSTSSFGPRTHTGHPSKNCWNTQTEASDRDCCAGDVLIRSLK